MNGSPPLPPPLRLKLTSDTATLAPTRKAVEQLARSLGFDDQAVGEIGLCVNEALANVMRHAYGGATGQPIELEALPTDDGIEIRVRDWGIGTVPPARPDETRDPLTPGGLGLVCLRRMMSRVVYHPLPDGMLLVMTRSRSASRPASVPMSELKISNPIITAAHTQGDSLVATLRGEIDLHNSPQLRVGLFELLRQMPAPRRIVLDVAEVSYIDSSAIAVLVEVIRRLRNAGGRLVLVNMAPRVRNVMEVTRLGTLIGAADSVEAALRD
jgi:anti-anti-sigma factor